MFCLDSALDRSGLPNHMQKLKNFLGLRKEPLLEDVEKGDSEFGREIGLDPLSMRPQAAWEQRKQRPQKLELPPLASPPDANSLRIVCISDTHGLVEKRQSFIDSIPEGDVLIHAGDFSMCGAVDEVVRFNEFLGKLPHPVKLVIAGNHDVTMEDAVMTGANARTHRNFKRTVADMALHLQSKQLQWTSQLLSNCTYLQDSGVEVCGIKIYGSPWVPSFGRWGFSIPRGEMLLTRWSSIPSDTDILITHGPPVGYGDFVFDGRHVGCVDLLNTVQRRVRPKYHIYGHIHEGYGMYTDGTTTFVNAATCTVRYKPNRRPIVFDVPLPHGHSKEELLQRAEEHTHCRIASDSEAAAGAVPADDAEHCHHNQDEEDDEDDYGEEEEDEEDEDDDFVEFVEPSDVV